MTPRASEQRRARPPGRRGVFFAMKKRLTWGAFLHAENEPPPPGPERWAYFENARGRRVRRTQITYEKQQ